MVHAATIDWGLIEYTAALEAQRVLVERRISKEIEDTLIFAEHPSVYTLGARKDAGQNLLWDANERERRGITLSQASRGGDVTYHGPGQIVGYPIVSLASHKDLHAYLRLLEDVLLSTLAHWQIKATRRDGKTGIWVNNCKIAAIGVAARQWVTYHGFALNVNCDLTPFQGIIPCGIAPEEGGVTSMAEELGQLLNLTAIKARLELDFWTNFQKAF